MATNSRKQNSIHNHFSFYSSFLPTTPFNLLRLSHCTIFVKQLKKQETKHYSPVYSSLCYVHSKHLHLVLHPFQNVSCSHLAPSRTVCMFGPSVRVVAVADPLYYLVHHHVVVWMTGQDLVFGQLAAETSFLQG